MPLQRKNHEILQNAKPEKCGWTLELGKTVHEFRK